jgi:hypothetical protein
VSEQWQGLHNPEWHFVSPLTGEGLAWCVTCSTDCILALPCRCCLAAEVETLRAQVERVREALCSPPNSECAEFLVEHILQALDSAK